jgi:hypothetical protein
VRSRASSEPTPRSAIGGFFAHPATLLLLGGAITALLSGLLVPAITRSWQSHDRKLERRADLLREELTVKSTLVKSIGTATAEFLGASQVQPFSDSSSSRTSLSGYDRAYARWSVRAAEVASQLAAYFPRSRSERYWRNYALNMRNVYLLLRAGPGRPRRFWLTQVAEYLGVPVSTIDGLLQPAVLASGRNPTYESALRELLFQLEQKEAGLVSLVVASTSALRTTSG